MMRKDAIYYFSAVDYNFLTQRPQQLFSEMQRRFNDKKITYYVEPYRNEISFRLLTNSSVLRLPFHYDFSKYGLSKFNFINNLSFKFMIKMRPACKRVAITCNTIWEPYLNKTCFDYICYDYLDALEVCRDMKDFDAIKRRHEKMLEKSDVIFVTAEKLKNEVFLTHPNKNVVLLSNGVDFDYFLTNCNSYNIVDYIKAGRKVVGYVGAIYDWVDLELVHATAKLTPDYDYVMIGPLNERRRLTAEKKPDNVIYLGPKPYEQVPSYINIFDVCLIPFVQSNIADSTDPIKLYEYFALGKPVVATQMMQLNKFNDHEKLIIAESSIDLAEAIRYMCDSDNNERQIKRKEIACLNSWFSKAELMATSVDNLLSNITSAIK